MDGVMLPTSHGVSTTASHYLLRRHVTQTLLLKKPSLLTPPSWDSFLQNSEDVSKSSHCYRYDWQAELMLMEHPVPCPPGGLAAEHPIPRCGGVGWGALVLFKR